MGEKLLFHVFLHHEIHQRHRDYRSLSVYGERLTPGRDITITCLPTRRDTILAKRGSPHCLQREDLSQEIAIPCPSLGGKRTPDYSSMSVYRKRPPRQRDCCSSLQRETLPSKEITTLYTSTAKDSTPAERCVLGIRLW